MWMEKKRMTIVTLLEGHHMRPYLSLNNQFLLDSLRCIQKLKIIRMVLSTSRPSPGTYVTALGAKNSGRARLPYNLCLGSLALNHTSSWRRDVNCRFFWHFRRYIPLATLAWPTPVLNFIICAIAEIGGVKLGHFWIEGGAHIGHGRHKNIASEHGGIAQQDIISDYTR